MFNGMTVAKIAVSLPEKQVAAARQAVQDGLAPSVSALVSRALTRELETYSLADVAAAFIAEDGEPGLEERAWALDAVRRMHGARPSTSA